MTRAIVVRGDIGMEDVLAVLIDFGPFEVLVDPVLAVGVDTGGCWRVGTPHRDSDALPSLDYPVYGVCFHEISEK